MKIISYLFPWIGLLNKDIVKNDIFAGISAAILILPQAIAFAIIAGLPPAYGLYTAIFPVLVASLFGSSWLMISGPNIALVVMIPLAVIPLASIDAAEYISHVITLTFMVGMMQLLFTFLGFTKFFIHFSHTVLLAITSSVGVTIILKQFDDILGLSSEILSFEGINTYALIIGLSTLVSGFVIRSSFKKWPYLIMATFIGMIVFYSIEIIFDTSDLALLQVGHITLSDWSVSQPVFFSYDFLMVLWKLLPWAFLIAMMGLIQSLLISKATAQESHHSLNLNREAYGQGLSNVLGSFLSCMPSGGSFNRSAANIDVGGKTPLVVMVSVVFLTFIIFIAEPFLATIPLAIIAGLLILVGLSMIKYVEIRRLFIDDKKGALLFVVSLFLTLIAGLSYGLVFGLSLSIWSYIKSLLKESKVN